MFTKAVAKQSESAEHILEVAARLFSQRGYDATSTREIVEAAGVTKPMLYYYFGSKEGLCRTAIHQFGGRFFDQVEETIRANGESREAIVELMWTYFAALEEMPEIARFYLGLYFGPDRHTFAADFEEWARVEHGMLRDFASRLAACGVLRPGCGEDFFIALSGMIHVWHMMKMIEGVTLTREIAQRTVDNLLRGFGSN